MVSALHHSKAVRDGLKDASGNNESNTAIQAAAISQHSFTVTGRSAPLTLLVSVFHHYRVSHELQLPQ